MHFIIMSVNVRMQDISFTTWAVDKLSGHVHMYIHVEFALYHIYMCYNTMYCICTFSKSESNIPVYDPLLYFAQQVVRSKPKTLTAGTKTHPPLPCTHSTTPHRPPPHTTTPHNSTTVQDTDVWTMMAGGHEDVLPRAADGAARARITICSLETWRRQGIRLVIMSS